MTGQQRTGLAFTTPVIVAILVLYVLPTAGALLLSLTDFDVYAFANPANLRFVWFANYRQLLTDPLFWHALGNTLVFSIVGVPLTLGVSLGAALMLDARGLRWRAFWRVALFAPYVTTLLAAAVLWRYLLDPRFGLLNRGLALLGIAPIDWLGDPRFSVPAILLFIAWKRFGYNMILFSAALTAVPADLMDAARLDGANLWTRLRHIVLPAIGPVLLLAGLLSVAEFLQIFDEPYVMTQGGPAQSTLTVLYFMFNRGFEWWDLGAASAVAVVLFALILCVTAVQWRIGRRAAWA